MLKFSREAEQRISELEGHVSALIDVVKSHAEFLTPIMKQEYEKLALKAPVIEEKVESGLHDVLAFVAKREGEIKSE